MCHHGPLGWGGAENWLALSVKNCLFIENVIYCTVCGTEKVNDQVRWTTHTLPRATQLVAMSRTKLSPFFPGAATDKGLVPKVTWLDKRHFAAVKLTVQLWIINTKHVSNTWAEAIKVFGLSSGMKVTSSNIFPCSTILTVTKTYETTLPSTMTKYYYYYYYYC